MTATSLPAPVTYAGQAALIAACQRGDDAAFDALYTRYWDQARCIVASYFSNRHDVDDLTQDTFLKAWLALTTGRYTDQGDFPGWLYRVTQNVCRDELRHRKLVRWEAIDAILAQGAASRHQRLFVSHDPLGQPERVMELRAEINERLASERGRETELHRAIASIPRREWRDALTLTEIGGLSYRAAAQALSSTVPSVKTRIFRARQWLRKQGVQVFA